MRPKLISLGYAVPERVVTQREVFDTLKYPEPFWKLYRDSGIEKRHFWVPLSRIRQLSFQEQQEEYKRGAIELSKQAAINCLDGRNPEDINCVTFCSCTGFGDPGPIVPHYLIDEVGFSPNTFFTNIKSQGCEAGYPGLVRAMDRTIVAGKPSLVICCELASCSCYPEPDGKPDPENHYELLRSNAIFADAASAGLVGYDDDPRHPYIIDSETYTNTAYLNDLGYVWRDGRLRVLLSKRIPELAAEVAGTAVNRLLERRSLRVKDIDYWVIHAAGNSVLDEIRDALGLSEEKVALSRETLQLYGNTSSTSVGITGKRMMLKEKELKGYCLMISVGPGMTGGATLLRFGE